MSRETSWIIEENARFDVALADQVKAAAIEKRLHDMRPELFEPPVRAMGFQWWLERAYEGDCKSEAPGLCPRCALRAAVLHAGRDR